jgi:hypothetical protein
LTCEGTRTYTYMYKDCAGLTAYWKYIYTIKHVTAPVVPQDGGSSVECIADATAPEITFEVKDVCGVVLKAELVSVVDNPIQIICRGTRTYTYTYTDCAGLKSTWNFVYTIEDHSKPQISCPKDIVKCFGEAVELGQATASDNCGTPVVTNNAPTTFPVGITYVTWTAKDACGNEATCEQKVTILQAPEINV